MAVAATNVLKPKGTRELVVRRVSSVLQGFREHLRSHCRCGRSRPSSSWMAHCGDCDVEGSFQAGLDCVEACGDLVELCGESVGCGALHAAPRRFDERRGDRGGDDSEEGDSPDYHNRGDEPSGHASWDEVLVPDRRDRLNRPPKAVADVGTPSGRSSASGPLRMMVTRMVVEAINWGGAAVVSGLVLQDPDGGGGGVGGTRGGSAGVDMIGRLRSDRGIRTWYRLFIQQEAAAQGITEVACSGPDGPGFVRAAWPPQLPRGRCVI